MKDVHTTALEFRLLAGTVSRISHQALEQRLADQNIELSRLQLGILRALDYTDGQTISELSRMFKLDPSTFVPSADSLEKKQYIKRQRDPNDRRRVPLYLTEKGAELIKEFAIITDDDILFVAMKAMGMEDAETLCRLMRELVRHLPEGEDLLKGIDSRVYPEK